MTYRSIGDIGKVEPKLYLQIRPRHAEFALLMVGFGLLGSNEMTRDVGGIMSMMGGMI